jgi:hypothetical protein
MFTDKQPSAKGLVQKVLILGNRRHSGEVDEGGEA